MGAAAGENRAIRAIENALSSPLLNSNDITGAKSILINISSGRGEHEITMDELGEITDYMYDAASDDALIIRGLSQDDSLAENISVTVIATGFEPNSIFSPYVRKGKKDKVELLADNAIVPPRLIPERNEGTIRIIDKKKKSIIADFEEESQATIDFGQLKQEEIDAIRERNNETEEESEKSEGTLQKVKHIQNMLKKEGLSNKTIKDNIDTFEDVPAYIRRNMLVAPSDKNTESKLSKFTLTSDDEEGPVLRENNAYLNDNVD